MLTCLESKGRIQCCDPWLLGLSKIEIKKIIFHVQTAILCRYVCVLVLVQCINMLCNVMSRVSTPKHSGRGLDRLSTLLSRHGIYTLGKGQGPKLYSPSCSRTKMQRVLMNRKRTRWAMYQ